MEQDSKQAEGIEHVSERAAFVPLDREERPTVNTAAAAYYLNRRPQTLRGWACKEDGPIRPLRVFGRLAWSSSEIRKLVGASS